MIGPFALGRLPRITFGPGAAADLAAVVARYGASVLIVTGRRSFRDSPRWAALLADLEARGIAYADEIVEGEPSPELVDALVGRHREGDADVVLGIGGGSALDTAKAVAGLLRSGTHAADHLEGLPGAVPYPGPALPWIGVPTTAGTGSEATRNAVLARRGPDGFKRSFRDERLVAAEAIVDPDLLAGVPAAVIAGNGGDAVTQLIEAYTTRRAGRLTDALALDGLAAARDALPAWHAAALEGRDDPEARTAMAYAATVGGIALANAGLGVVHGIVATVGARTDTPHGAGCGALLSAGVAANIRALETRDRSNPALARYATLGRLLAGLPAAAPDDAARGELIRWLGELVTALRLPGLAAYGVTDDLVAPLAEESRTASSTKANPIELTVDELAGIIAASL